MTDAEALERAVTKRNHPRFRELVDPAHPDYQPAYWRVIREIAEGKTPTDPPRPVPPRPARDDRPLPSLVRQAASAAVAVAQHAVAGFPEAPTDVYETRVAACQACDRFRATDGRCGVCGCFVIALKARWLEQHCPLGRWPGDPHPSS